MDRLKIRVWDEKEKQMLNVRSIDFNDMTIYNANNKNFNKSYNESDMSEYGWGLLEDLVFMQCTGLKDKYDNLIYEYDVVEFDGNSLYICKYNEHRCEFAWYSYSDNIYLYPIGDVRKNLEIVGHIYE